MPKLATVPTDEKLLARGISAGTRTCTLLDQALVLPERHGWEPDVLGARTTVYLSDRRINPFGVTEFYVKWATDTGQVTGGWLSLKTPLKLWTHAGYPIWHPPDPDAGLSDWDIVRGFIWLDNLYFLDWLVEKGGEHVERLKHVVKEFGGKPDDDFDRLIQHVASLVLGRKVRMAELKNRKRRRVEEEEIDEELDEMDEEEEEEDDEEEEEEEEAPRRRKTTRTKKKEARVATKTKRSKKAASDEESQGRLPLSQKIGNRLVDALDNAGASGKVMKEAQRLANGAQLSEDEYSWLIGETNDIRTKTRKPKVENELRLVLRPLLWLRAGRTRNGASAPKAKASKAKAKKGKKGKKQRA